MESPERGRSRSPKRIASSSSDQSWSRSRSRARSISKTYSPSSHRSSSPRKNRNRSRSPSLSRSRSKSPKRKQASSDTNAVFVRGLTKNVHERHLHEIFSGYGKVNRVDLATFQRSGENRGHGYVVFSRVAEAEKAMIHMDHGQIDGNVLSVKVCRPPHSPPPPSPLPPVSSSRRANLSPRRRTAAPLPLVDRGWQGQRLPTYSRNRTDSDRYRTHHDRYRTDPDRYRDAKSSRPSASPPSKRWTPATRRSPSYGPESRYKSRSRSRSRDRAPRSKSPSPPRRVWGRRNPSQSPRKDRSQSRSRRARSRSRT